jgi:outer membrane lipoprotein-sorting protein
MSKKVFLFLALIISVTNYSFAQTNASAKNILDGVSNKLKAYKGITANFSYTTKDRKNVKRGSVDGQISIKGEKYFIKQGSTEIYSDGSKTWNYNGENEVTVSEADDESKSLTPQKLLSDFYDKDFTYNLVSSAGNYYEIAMIPTDKRKNFKQVNVFVDKAKNIITKAKVLDKGDNTIEFSLTNVNTNAAIPDTRFVFDATKHPGVEVIEQ